MGWNTPDDQLPLRMLELKLRILGRGRLDRDERIDFEEAIKHIHQRHRDALLLYAKGYSKREVARMMGSNQKAMLVLRAERAMLEELRIMRVWWADAA